MSITGCLAKQQLNNNIGALLSLEHTNVVTFTKAGGKLEAGCQTFPLVKHGKLRKLITRTPEDEDAILLTQTMVS